MNTGANTRAAAPDENPVARLAACHADIHQHCSVLEEASRQTNSHDGTAARLKTAIAYFDIEVLHHHVIEERELFARLAALPTTVAGSAEVASLVAALRADHRLLEAMWASLRPMLLEMPATRSSSLRTDVYSFVTSYRHHMKREEAGIFPLVSRLLDQDALKAIADAMEAPHRAVTNAVVNSPDERDTPRQDGIF